jgi:DNA mismatch repair protein MSH4
LAEFEEKDGGIPDVFINVVRRKKMVECQTLELVKLNQKITDAHNEVVNMSDRTIQGLIEEVRTKIHPLFKISEGIAMVDMIAAFAQLVTTQEYSKPEITATLAIQAGRHPVREKIQHDRYVPNDVYADASSRFQIITGCNMSGKSTYIRSIALMTVMAQVGCFVPAQYGSFPMTHSLFARVSTDDNIEANVSTFASEMRETAFILRNMEKRSLIIIDELGRGTSTTDGLAIAIAIAESLIESGAYVWFVTHFRDLPRILAERAGVVNLHLAVDISAHASKMKMLYKIADGYEEEKFYGLALARVVNLPEQVMDIAAEVSTALNERNEARKSNAKALAVARKRKLVLTLKQQLLHAKNGNMNPENLRQWLQKLQEEFLVRMSAINEEANAVVEQQRDVTVETEDGRESTISADDLRQEDNGRIQRRETIETESSNQKFPGQPLRVKEMSRQHTGEQGGKSLSVSPSQFVESVEAQSPSATNKRERLVHHHPFITPSVKLEPCQRKWAGDLAEDPIEIDDDD